MKTSDSFSNAILQKQARKRAATLRALYREHVEHPHGDKNWQRGAEALVPAEIADDVAEAMGFVGSAVAERRDRSNGLVFLRSSGLRAHSS